MRLVPGDRGGRSGVDGVAAGVGGGLLLRRWLAGVEIAAADSGGDAAFGVGF